MVKLQFQGVNKAHLNNGEMSLLEMTTIESMFQKMYYQKYVFLKLISQFTVQLKDNYLYSHAFVHYK